MSTHLNKIPSKLTLKLWKLSPSIKSKLKYIIYLNELFVTDEIKNKNDDGQLIRVISKSVSATYKKYQNEQHDTILEITFEKIGQLQIDTKLTCLESSLMAVLNATDFLDMNTTHKNVIYRLITHEIPDPCYILDPENKPLIGHEKALKLNKYNTWKLDSNFSSLGIFGTAGSGKSRLAYYIINQAMTQTKPQNLYIVDPKNDELAIYSKNIFHLKNVATDFDHALTFAKKIFAEMEKRYQLNQEHGRPLKHDHLFFVIDELAALKLESEPKSYKEFETICKSLALKGRAAKIHLVLICQRPSTESIPADIRDQLKIRILLGDVSNHDTFKMALGDTKSSADITINRIGTGFIRFEGKPIMNFKSPEILTKEEAKQK